MLPILILLVGLGMVGCASTPQTGVRPEFQTHILTRVAVVPFYAQTNFSLTPEELDAVLRESEHAAVESLRGYGFEVIAPPDFRDHLERVDAAALFDEGIVLHAELGTYFEPAKSANGPALEVATLAELNRDGALRVDALLFGEVVYYTETQCNADPNTTQSREAPRGSAETTPCVVSHFQAKLVYVPTGETMWFNRAFLETYPPPETPDAGAQTLTQTVLRTFEGDDGLADLSVPQASTTPDTRVASE